MIEKIIRDYLLSVLTVPVYTDVPANPPESYCVIERTGGGNREHIRDAQIVVDSYGSTRWNAASLHEEVLKKLPDIATGDVVSSCEVNSEYDNTDTETKRYRYGAYFNVVYY